MVRVFFFFFSISATGVRGLFLFDHLWARPDTFTHDPILVKFDGWYGTRSRVCVHLVQEQGKKDFVWGERQYYITKKRVRIGRSTAPFDESY